MRTRIWDLHTRSRERQDDDDDDFAFSLVLFIYFAAFVAYIVCDLFVAG